MYQEDDAERGFQHDELTLKTITKRYTNIRTWNKPTPKVLEALNNVLEISKINSLQYMNKSSKKLKKSSIPVEAEIDEFIATFLQFISNADLPDAISEKDYNFDYQNSRLKYFESLYSNEQHSIKLLTESLVDENKKLKRSTNFVKNFKNLFNDELNSLTPEEIEFFNLKHKQYLDYNIFDEDVYNDDNGNDDDNENNDDNEFNELISDLEQSLTDLSEKTVYLSAIADKLDYLETILT